ncbi:hypothetical protein CPC08DRAFT_668612 [Agrocybe pediades]|nr:hypothetical protein CPC08DRAFT_668612 [Agrocybe pediades]
MGPLVSLINVCLVVSTSLLSKTVKAERRSVTTNCTAQDSTPCGPAPSCCSSGFTCNYRRGIPFCEDESQNFIEGYDRDPCLDPYLFRCDEVVEIPGFCCPTGTSCFTNGIDNIVQCVNALGTTASAIPSGTTGVIPSATPITAADPSIVYSPPTGAWSTADSPGNCAISSSVRVTQTVNASISFNYTGTSIMIHTITSTTGGSFSLIVDGFNTTSSVDTLAGIPDSDVLPTCYPNQYPPFVITPPGYATRKTHSITLVYTGPAPHYTASDVTNIQFDGFSVPDPALTLLGQAASAGVVGRKLEMSVLMSIMLLTICFTL